MVCFRLTPDMFKVAQLGEYSGYEHTAGLNGYVTLYRIWACSFLKPVMKCIPVRETIVSNIWYTFRPRNDPVGCTFKIPFSRQIVN